MVRFVHALFPAALVGLALAPGAGGQTDNPVYVDDSPQAWEQFRQAQDHARPPQNNAGEAVRLYQELLDQFAFKLIPAGETTPDYFKAVRQRVLEALRADQALLERYRLVQTPQAEQLLQANPRPPQQLERLAMTRSLTEPGLEALLQLAQRDLEAGHFQTSRLWLEQARAHPDLIGRRAVHCQFMLGMIAHYLSRPEQARAALAALAQAGTEGEACHAQLERLLAAAAGPPTAAPAATILDRGNASQLDDLVAQAIWSVPLDDSLVRRRFAALQEEQAGPPGGGGAGANVGGLIEQRLRDADLTTAAPTVVGPMVYVNQGQTVMALNRLTGHQEWSYSNLNRMGFTERDVQGSLDMNLVAVSGDALVTLTGYALPTSRSDSGRVICLDAQTGSLRWSANLSGVVDAAAGEDLFPHGAPIIADGLVLVAARRVAGQALTSAYVVALNLTDGQVRWVRYITSSGGLRAGIRPFCTLNYHDGAVYISSAVGATARLVPATGEIRWLVRFNVPITPSLADQSRRPWEITGPVVTPRGVLVVQPDQRRVVLLDAETGDRLESHDAGTAADWAMPRYLLADDLGGGGGGRVFAIGADIRCFDLNDLEHPVWRLPAPQKSEVSDQKADVGGAADLRPLTSDLSSLELRGRVQVVDGSLIAPTAEGVLVLDSETGALRNRLAVEPIGNPLAFESQLLLACGDRLDAYMSFSKAERMLRERMAQVPDDPEPALSLLRLGMRVRNLKLALEAAELASGALDRRSGGAANAGDRRVADARRELFAVLLELAAARIAAGEAEGELLYATIGAAATENQQRVEYLLAYGDWLADHAVDRAVESYQNILTDHVLAESWRIEAGTMLPSAALARQRLADLIRLRGPAVYAPQADYAAIRLKQIGGPEAGSGRRDESDFAALFGLAMQYPFADAAPDAALLAADIQTVLGHPRAALAALGAVYRAAPRPQAAERLLGKFVSICTAAGWTNQVQAVINHVLATHGDVALVTDAGTIRPSAWLDSAKAADRAALRRLPAIGQPAGELLTLTGGMVPPFQMPGAGRTVENSVLPPDRALLQQGNSLVLLGPQKMEPLWTGPPAIGEGLAQVLRFDDRGILLWIAADSQDPPQSKAIMLNTSDGTIRWTTPRLAEVLAAEPGREPGRNRSFRAPPQIPDGEPLDPLQTIALVNDKSIILVQRAGGIAAIDLADGKTVQWTRKLAQIGLEQMHGVMLHDSALVLAGLSRDVEGGKSGAVGNPAAELVPRLLVLDPQTGQPLFDQSDAIGLLGRSGVRWMKISPLGLLACGMAEGVDVMDLYSGKRCWSSTARPLVETQHAWGGPLDDRIVVEDQRSRLRTVNLRDARSSEPFEMSAGIAPGEWDPVELKSVLTMGGRIIAHYPQRIVMYDAASGAIAGADVVSDERDYRWLLAAQDRFLVINGQSVPQPVADQPGRRTLQWQYRVYMLSENCKVLGVPLELPALGDRLLQARVIDGWLLVSTQSTTLAVPMPKAKD